MAEPHSVRIHGGRTIYTVQSRNDFDIELGQLLVDGELPDLAQIEDMGLLFLRFKKRKVTIAAGGYIGIIPLTPSVTVEVIPKLPARNLARILDVARSNLIPLRAGDREYLGEEEPTTAILEFLCLNYMDALDEIEAGGLHKQYAAREETTSYPSGRLNISASLVSHWGKGLRHIAKSSRFEQSSDTSENRVLRSALLMMLERLRSLSPGAKKLFKRGNRSLDQFPLTVRDAGQSDIERTRSTLSGKALPRQRDYYYRAIDIALLVLSNGGFSLNLNGSDVLMRSLVVNFDTLFESYIRNALALNAGGAILVLDGNRDGKKRLFDDQKEPTAQPDIVLEAADTRSRIVIEVKYRGKTKREDINQSFTYAASYRTKTGVIAHQLEGNRPSGLRHLGKIGDVSMVAYAFNLDSENLPSEEKRFADAMATLVAESSGMRESFCEDPASG